jgi:hypothetical protein
MDLRAWIGLGLIVLYLGGGYLRVRSQRRSGATHSFGHPVLDNVLLFISGLLAAGTLGFALWFLKSHSHRIETRFFTYILLLTLGGALTWLCNLILRSTRK